MNTKHIERCLSIRYPDYNFTVTILGNSAVTDMQEKLTGKNVTVVATWDDDMPKILVGYHGGNEEDYVVDMIDVNIMNLK